VQEAQTRLVAAQAMLKNVEQSLFIESSGNAKTHVPQLFRDQKGTLFFPTYEQYQQIVSERNRQAGEQPQQTPTPPTSTPDSSKKGESGK
jgi:hypothetical protein